jgi:hypothetical protein
MIVGDLTGPEPASEKPAEQRPGWDGFDTFQKAFSQIKQMHCSHSYWLLLLHLPKPQGFGGTEKCFRAAPRLCKALLDRITDRAHIIETGTESFRFRRTVERRKKH